MLLLPLHHPAEAFKPQRHVWEQRSTFRRRLNEYNNCLNAQSRFNLKEKALCTVEALTDPHLLTHLYRANMAAEAFPLRTARLLNLN